MKVLFVSPSFFPATYYGGPTVLNQELCQALAKCPDVELEVLTTDSDGPHRRIDSVAANSGSDQSFAVQYCRRHFQPDIALGLLARLPQMVGRADIVHLHGVYCFTTIPTLALCSLLRKPVVWSASGALQRWESASHSKSKLVFEKLCDAFCKANRVVLHTASETERLESQRRLKNVSENVIAFGVSFSGSEPIKTANTRPMRLLFIGRLHPIKGLENLLLAMRQARTVTSLAICGEGDQKYEMKLRSLVNELGLGNRVQFLGPVSGPAKERQFQEADLCIVASFKESFGAVVTESLARAVPVIASRGTPWQAVEEVGCGLWVGNEPEALAQAIDRAASMPLRDAGLRGREWIRKEFSWDKSAARFIETYRSLIESSRRQKVTAVGAPKTA